MRIDLLKKLENLKFEETEYGFKLVGFKETIHPLAICAKLKYGKKLKSKRLMKKYAKVFLKDIIEDFVRRYNANEEKSNTVNNDL